MPTPPTTGHVILDNTPLIIEPGSYSKGPSSLYTAAPLRLDAPINLSPLSTFKQDTFRGGMGQEHWKDTEMYYLGDADTRFGWAQCKIKLSRNTGTVNDNSRKLYAIRSQSAGTAPRLYFCSDGSKTLKRQLHLGGQVVNAWVAPSSTISALGRSFYGSQYGLHIGMNNGDLWAIPSGSEVAEQKPRITSINARVTFLDSLGARGDIAGIVNGQLYKTTTGTWTKFATLDMPVYDGEQWNQRMWVVGHDASQRSALYVTDTITTQEVYRWPASFIAQAVVAYSGQLFIFGGTFNDEFKTIVGQVWSYNGSSMRLVFEIPGDIFRPLGFNSFNIWGGVAYRKWLAFAFPHKGVWFYDAEQDAIHPGPQLDGVTEDTNDFVTAVTDFGGKLVAANWNESTFHFQADPIRYWPSYLMSSEYDAGLPGQSKTWVRCRLRLKEPLPAGTSVQVLYTIQHVEQDINIGPTWQTLATFGSVTGKTIYSAEIPGPPVFSEAIRFQLRLIPSPFLGNADNRTPKVQALEVDYLVVPDTKFGWTFRILGTPNYSRPDGQPYGINVSQLQAALDAAQRNSSKRWVTFVDEDGTNYKVQIIDIRIFKPVIDHSNPDSEFATWTVQLAEV